MKWIARIFVFIITLVFGTFAASLFWDDSRGEAIVIDVPAPIAPVAAVKAPIRAESLLGTWKGTWDHNDGDCTIEIDRVDGNVFYGTLRKEGAVVLFEGKFDPNTRMLYFNETKVVRLGAYSEWSLGKNSGVISPDGHTLVGSGRDKWGWYGWAASNY
jgi:hypothetical protein